MQTERWSGKTSFIEEVVFMTDLKEEEICRKRQLGRKGYLTEQFSVRAVWGGVKPLVPCVQGQQERWLETPSGLLTSLPLLCCLHCCPMPRQVTQHRSHNLPKLSVVSLTLPAPPPHSLSIHLAIQGPLASSKHIPSCQTIVLASCLVPGLQLLSLSGSPSVYQLKA